MNLGRQGIVVLLPESAYFGDAVGAPFPTLVQRESSFAFVHFQYQQIGGFTRAYADIYLVRGRTQVGELLGPQFHRLTEVQFQRGAFRRLHPHQDPAQLLVMRRVGYQEILEVQVLLQVEDSAHFFLADSDGKILGGQM